MASSPRVTTLTSKYAALAAAIESRLGDKLTRMDSAHGELGYQLAAADLVACARILRDDEACRFEMLMDICGVDYLSYGRDEWDTASATSTGFSRGVLPDQTAGTDKIADTQYRPERRFAVVYHLLSITHNHRVRLKIFCVDEERPMADSVISIWSSADWYEREAFDLFGIAFVGHPDLRRLLTDYGFIGHPFRKDFPLIGNVEMRYDPSKGRVVYEPVSIEPRTLVPKTIRDDNRYDPGLKDDGDA